MRYRLIVVVNGRRIVAYEGTAAACQRESLAFTRFVIEEVKRS